MSDINKQKQLEYQRNWYQRNKERHKANAKKNRERYHKIANNFIIEYLSSHPCIDCGESDIVVLDFDHVRGIKKNNISNMLTNKASLTTLENEIEKCDIRCANCHRRKTAKERNFYRLISEEAD